jgi:hypothetical protein
MYRVDETVRAAMTTEERAWLRSTWRSPAVTAMRRRHVALGQALVTEPVGTQRSAVLREQRALTQAFGPKEMPPLSARTDWLTGGRAPSKPRSTRKVIRTSPNFWTRDGSPAVPVDVPHEIVVRFPDRGPLRLRGMINRAEADQAARRMMGKILMGDTLNLSLRTATGYIIVPDGQGPDGAEVVDLPRNENVPARPTHA